MNSENKDNTIIMVLIMAMFTMILVVCMALFTNIVNSKIDKLSVQIEQVQSHKGE